MRDNSKRLQDIHEAITQIEKYSIKGKDTFYKDELIQSWVVRHLQIIGEAARAISDDLKQSHPEVPWSKMTGMRNILVHDYFGIDRDIVWGVVQNELPNLKHQIHNLLNKSN